MKEFLKKPDTSVYATTNKYDWAWAQMTADSDTDIAWVRPGRENSGTMRNIQRRKK